MRGGRATGREAFLFRTKLSVGTSPEQADIHPAPITI
jgi:hypothetical protein